MTRKIIMVCLMQVQVLLLAYTASAQSADRPTVPVPIWNKSNPSTQSYNTQPLSTQPLTAPPASITPVETLNGFPLKRATSATQSIKQLQVKTKQKKIKSDTKGVDAKAANPTAAVQHQTIPVRKMTPLPPTQKKVKNPATPEQK